MASDAIRSLRNAVSPGSISDFSQLLQSALELGPKLVRGYAELLAEGGGTTRRQSQNIWPLG